MKDQFTYSSRKIGIRLALSLVAIFLMMIAPGVSEAQNTVDIGLFNSTTNPNEVEVRVRPDFSTTSNLTNIIFTIKWDASAGVTITPGTPTFPYLVSPQTAGTSGGSNYQIFGSAAGQTVNWTAGNEYVVFTFTYNSCTGFEIAPATDTWTTANNGLYYIEMFSAQLDHTGAIYESPLVCLSPVPAPASAPSPADGAQYVAYNGSNQIDLGWEYVSDPLFADPDSFRIVVGAQTFTVPFVSGQSVYSNAVQITPSFLTNVDWTVTPFNASGDAQAVPTWSFLTAPAPLTVDAMISGANTICLGDTAYLMGDASGGVYPMSWAWGPSTGLSNDTVSNPMAFPTATTTYTLTITDQLGSTATDAVTVNVNVPNVTISADDTICEGECSLIMVTGGEFFSWSTTETTASISACPTQTTTYFVTVTDINSCIVETSATVFVNPLPVVTFSALSDFCIEDAAYVLVEGSPAGGVYSGAGVTSGSFDPASANVGSHTLHYSYTDANGCVNSDSSALTVHPMPLVDLPAFAGVCLDASAFALTTATPAGGVYSGNGVSNGSFDPATAGVGVHMIYYSYTDVNGCGGMDSASIEVFALPTVSAGSPLTVCEGECTDLTATGGYTYDWDTNGNTATINVCPSQTTTYYVTVTDINSCVAMDNVTVTVNPAPIANAGADQTVCAGGCANLLASGGVSYAWSTTELTADITVCPTETETYTVVVTDANGCQSSDDVSVFVNPLPVVDLPAFAGMCFDASALTLTSGTPAGGVYSGTGVSGGIFDPAVAGVGVHMIYYSYTDINNCSGMDSASMEVFALPQASAGLDVTVCEGLCTDLTATGGASYVWSTSATTATITVCPAQTTLYTVTVTDANSCVAFADVTVSINPLPIANAGADASICAGDCADLLATGGDSYVWSTLETTAGINVCPVSTTEYFVTVTDLNGCQDVDAVTVTVNPLPVANAGPDAAICLGDCATLTASGGLSYEWNTLETTASITVCPTDSTFYTVTVTGAGGCSATDVVEVIVNPAAIISAQPADVGVDLGSAATFVVIANGASGYQWQVSADGGSTWTDVVDGAVYVGATTAALTVPITTLNLDGYMYRAELGSPCGPSVMSGSATLSVVSPAISATIPTMSACASDVVIPIIVVKALGVGAISLTLNYDANVLVFDTFQNLHPSLLNGYLTVVNPSANSVYFSWHSVSPLNILFDTLVELVFHSPNGGTSAVSWDLVTPGNCEFSDVAANVIPSTFISGMVTAIPSPAVTSNPLDADITEGQNTSFTVAASNATGYQWQMSSDNGASWNNLVDGSVYQGSNTATLTIYNATVYMDDFQYRCVVSGTCSPDDISNAAMLNVRPIITTYIGQITRCADEIIVPVYVSHMYGVAGISLTLGFNTVVLNYVGLHSSHPAITTANLYDNSTYGKVYLSWYSTTPVDLGDTVLVELRFTSPNGGTSNLVWDMSAADNNQYNNLASEIISTVWQNGVVHVQPSPLAYNVTGGGEYCAGGNGVMIGLSGSQTGRIYELFLDGAPTGQVVSGTGAAISFGYQISGGNYTVLATNPSTTCDYEMIGSKNVVVNPLPIADAGTDVSILSGTSTLLDGAASAGTPGYSYNWMPGSFTTEDITVSPSVTTTYTLGVTDSKACFDDDAVTVTVYANTISGQVTYDNDVHSPMSNVSVYLNDDSKAVVASDVTDANGNYSFPPVPNGTYTITSSTTKPWGGVNSTDALKIMHHFIRIDSLTGLALAAADVDASGYVNTTDAFRTAQRFAQLITYFNSGDWLFEVPVVVLNGDNFVTVDFMGICYGDVNRSHVPAAKATSSLSLQNKSIVPFTSGKVVNLPVTIEQSAEMGALSLVLNAPAGVSILDVTSDFANEIVWSFENSQLRASWYSTNAISLSAGDALITVKVRVADSFRGESSFELGNESEIADPYANIIHNAELAMPKIASGAISNDISLSNYPNPFSGSTNIRYTLPENGNVTLTVYNILGSEVAVLINSFQNSGQHSIEFNAAGLTPGIYQYRLQFNGNNESTLTRSMIISE